MYGEEGVVYVMVYVVVYLFVVMVLILVNKYLIMEMLFNCLVFVSSLGSWFGWGVAAVVIKFDLKCMLYWLSVREWMVNILLIGFCIVLLFVVVNVVYLYLSLSFI